MEGAAKGFSPNNSSDEEIGTPKGSEVAAEETIKNLHQELQSLRRERSNLNLQIHNLKAEIEESKAAIELELERGKKDGEIRALVEEARAWKSKAEEMERVLDEVRSKNSELEARIEEMASKKRDRVDAETKISVSKEEEMGTTLMRLRVENTDLGGTVCKYEGTFSKEDVLENTLRKMVDRNTELERKLGELATTVGPSFSWATAMAVAACTGAVAIAVTAMYLRGQC